MDRRAIEYFSGCLLGGAIGDALGAPIEFASLAEIRSRYGRDGLAEILSAGQDAGGGNTPAKITDDTQMTMFTAEGLIRAVCRGSHRGICDPVSVVYHAYVRWLHTQGVRSKNRAFDEKDDGWLIAVQSLHHRRAPGNTCVSALQSGRMGVITEPINSSKGCGGVMRIAPVGLFCESSEAFDMGCKIAATTHGHPSGYLAAGCLASIIAEIIDGESILDAIDTAARVLVTKPHHQECLHAIEQAQRFAADPSIPQKPETVERLGQGWVAEEALGISIYCALVAAGESDFRRAVLLAVNHSGDSDSTGAITGNILGACFGKSAIPTTWVRQLELRQEIEELAADLITRFRDEDDWWKRYPGW